MVGGNFVFHPYFFLFTFKRPKVCSIEEEYMDPSPYTQNQHQVLSHSILCPLLFYISCQQHVVFTSLYLTKLPFPLAIFTTAFITIYNYYYYHFCKEYTFTLVDHYINLQKLIYDCRVCLSILPLYCFRKCFLVGHLE